jgi:hypothetical protein
VASGLFWALWESGQTIVLLAGSPISAKELRSSVSWLLGHLPDLGPSCPVAQFVRLASSRKSSILMETTVRLETFKTLEIVLNPTESSLYFMV